MRTRQALVLIGAFLLSGCGTMNVQVEVLDPAYLEEVRAQTIDPDDLLPELIVSLAQSDEALSAALIDMQQAHISSLQDYASEYRNLANNFRQQASDLGLSEEERNILLVKANTFEGSADSLVDQQFIEEHVNPIYNEAYSVIAGANSDIRLAFNGLDNPTRGRILGGQERIGTRLSSLLTDRREAIEALLETTRDELNEQGDATTKKLSNALQLTPEQRQAAVANINEATAQAEAQVTGTANSIIGESGVFLSSDPLAYAVASAPEDYWAKFYNKAFAQGAFGNVNVAIKLASTGNFTIKGVTFDPSTVAQVASKVTTQAVIMAAQMYGVPISTPNASGDGAALAQSSSRLAGTQQRAAAIAAVQRDIDAALIDIAQAIVQQRTALAADTTRTQAIQTIRATFDAQKPRLQFTVPAANP